jgi:hypothetical protein
MRLPWHLPLSLLRLSAQVVVFQQGYVCPHCQTLPGPGGWLTPPDGAAKPSPHPVHDPAAPVPGHCMVRLPSPLLQDSGNIHHKPLCTYRCLQPASAAYQEDLPTEPPGFTETLPECGSDTSRHSSLGGAMGRARHQGTSHPGRMLKHRVPPVAVAAEQPPVAAAAEQPGLR